MWYDDESTIWHIPLLLISAIDTNVIPGKVWSCFVTWVSTMEYHAHALLTVTITATEQMLKKKVRNVIVVDFLVLTYLLRQYWGCSIPVSVQHRSCYTTDKLHEQWVKHNSLTVRNERCYRRLASGGTKPKRLRLWSLKTTQSHTSLSMLPRVDF